VSTVCVFEFVRSDSFPTALFRQNICVKHRDGESLTGADVPQDPETKQSQ